MISNIPLSAVKAERPTREPAIYFLAKRGVVVYVGQTNNLSRRISGHRCNRRNPGGIARKNWDALYQIPASDSKADRLRAERRFIQELKPRFNCPLTMGLQGKILGQRKILWLAVRADDLFHIRLDEDVARAVQISAKTNSRSMVKEVNHLLRSLLPNKKAKT